MVPDTPRDRAEQVVGDLEQRVDVLAGDTSPDARLKADRMARLEGDLLAALPEFRAVDEQLAAATGHPVLADTAAWRDLSRGAGAPQAADAADRLVARLIEDEAANWEERVTAVCTRKRTSECFRAMADARTFDLEALARRRTEPPLARFRPQLRQAFLDAITADPPTGAQRDAWTEELRDRANVVLTGVDEVDPERAAAQLGLIADELLWHASHVESARGERQRRLRRRARRLANEQQERELQARMEQRYGTARVAFLERLVLWLILLVLALFAFEAFSDLGPAELFWLNVTDTFACVIFLTEFFVKLSLVRDKPRWFARHFLIDFLPSIPFGMISFGLEWMSKADALRSVRAVRFLRLGRLARYARILRPFIRGARVFGFLTRGIDRVVRKYGELLNRNIVLYPTRQERENAEAITRGLGHRVRVVEARVNERWERLLTTALHEEREEIAARRVAGIEEARVQGQLQRAEREAEAPAETRDLPASEVLFRMATVTPQELEAQMGQDFISRIARAVRLLAYSPFRFIPPFWGFVPGLSRGMTDAEVVAAAAHKAAAKLQRRHDLWFWFADLHGAITPAQFVDRVGTAMFKGALRPAYRLALVGLFYLAVKALLVLIHIPGLDQMANNVWAKFGQFLQILGAIAIIVLGIGWWLRRIAGQATDFFAQSAKAQFISLTEAVKSRHIDRDAEILDRHVFAPERLLRGEADGNLRDQHRFRGSVRQWLVEAQSHGGGGAAFDAVERAVLLYRDGLDGALLVDSDTRVSSQLLGSPSLRNLRLLSRRFTRKDQGLLNKLDLERGKSGFSGPYLWFALICQAIAHGSARLIVDYNRNALPLRQREQATENERRRFEAWLRSEKVGSVPHERVMYVTTDFNALHFLDDDPDRDADVEARFGVEVLERLRRDRRHLFRRVFGTYPLHNRPREQRVVNLYRVYQQRIAGARVLLLPFVALWNAISFGGRFLRWLFFCVKEVRSPTWEVNAAELANPDFLVALRKIQRMRGPAAQACIWLRARFDPEYLGVRLPGTERSGFEEREVNEDLDFVGARPAFRHQVEEERQRAARDIVRLSRLLAGGLAERVGELLGRGSAEFTREQVRAAASLYVADVRRVRSHLSCRVILDEVYERAARKAPLPRLRLPRIPLYRVFRRYWAQHGSGGPEERRAAWRATVHNLDGVADALRAWNVHGEGTSQRGEVILARLLRHPERLTDQIVTLRIVQTLSLIDMLNYREHVYRLGQYEQAGNDPGDSLTLS